MISISTGEGCGDACVSAGVEVKIIDVLLVTLASPRERGHGGNEVSPARYFAQTIPPSMHECL